MPHTKEAVQVPTHRHRRQCLGSEMPVNGGWTWYRNTGNSWHFCSCWRQGGMPEGLLNVTVFHNLHCSQVTKKCCGELYAHSRQCSRLLENASKDMFSPWHIPFKKSPKRGRQAKVQPAAGTIQKNKKKKKKRKSTMVMWAARAGGPAKHLHCWESCNSCNCPRNWFHSFHNAFFRGKLGTLLLFIMITARSSEISLISIIRHTA